MDTPSLEDRLHALADDIIAELKQAEDAARKAIERRDYLVVMHNSLLKLMPATPTPEPAPEPAEPASKPTMPMAKAISLILSAKGRTGMDYDGIRSTLQSQGYNVGGRSCGQINVCLYHLTTTRQVEKHDGRYFFIGNLNV